MADKYMLTDEKPGKDDSYPTQDMVLVDDYVENGEDAAVVATFTLTDDMREELPIILRDLNVRDRERNQKALT